MHRCGEDVNTATRSSCLSTCGPASILLRACSAIRCPRVLLSLASAPLICDGKPIPLVNLPPKSYDWGYGYDTESLCDTESCCNFASALQNTHLSQRVTIVTHHRRRSVSVTVNLRNQAVSGAEGWYYDMLTHANKWGRDCSSYRCFAHPFPASACLRLWFPLRLASNAARKALPSRCTHRRSDSQWLDSWTHISKHLNDIHRDALKHVCDLFVCICGNSFKGFT